MTAETQSVIIIIIIMWPLGIEIGTYFYIHFLPQFLNSLGIIFTEGFKKLK